MVVGPLQAKYVFGRFARSSAILGAAKVAHVLGTAWKKSGHEVILGARDASATDPDFEITSLQDALAVGDVIVDALTGAAALEAITALDPSAMAGKTLLDVERRQQAGPFGRQVDADAA